MTVQVVPVPCLRDNYAYLVRAGEEVAVVDPSEANPVLEALAERGWRPTMIWNTHHHWDHVGGNEALVAQFPGLKVLAHCSDAHRVPGFTTGLEHGSHFQLGNGPQAQRVDVLFHPGHTLGAISYCIAGQVFTGDTLFGAGCGRVFEGTHEQMYLALNEVLGDLRDSTQLYFGHEYTAANLRFAHTVEPQNRAVLERQKHLSQSSVPATLALERQTNPFLRCHVPEVRQAAEGHCGHALTTPAAVFAVLRQWKDQF